MRTSLPRVLRLMRENGLLAPQRPGRVRGPRPHDGTITTTAPDVMWGTDATTTLTTKEGNATIFIAVDHYTAECLAIHAARPGTRYEAVEVLRQAVRGAYGAYGPAVAVGLLMRHDNGSVFISDVFQDELKFLGIESSPSFVRQPEGNGCAERIIRTLKEQLLWTRSFDTVEDLRIALHEWRRLYNEHWLIEKNGFLTPNQARSAFLSANEVA